MLSVLLLGCAPETPLSRVEVASADLEGISIFNFAAVGGGGAGSASLVVTEPDGRTHTFPIAIRAVTAGVVFDVGQSLDFGQDRALELPEGEALRADQLLGRYRGVGASIVLGAGVRARDLENRHGVGLDKATFAVGAGVFVGWEQLHLSLGDRYGEVHAWEDFIVDDSAADDSPGWDSSGPDSDGPDSSGPDSSGPDSDDPDSPPGSTGGGCDAPSDTGEPRDEGEAVDCGGCAGDGGADCVGCAGAGRGASWLVALVAAGLARRRRC